MDTAIAEMITGIAKREKCMVSVRRTDTIAGWLRRSRTIFGRRDVRANYTIVQYVYAGRAITAVLYHDTAVIAEIECSSDDQAGTIAEELARAMAS